MSHTNTTFHLQLLLKTMNIEPYPFTKLVIMNNLSDQEYEELFTLLEGLNETYEAQKEDGLLDFTSLLVHFAGMLNQKLHPTETIYALKKEGYFPKLMSEFVQIINDAKRRPHNIFNRLPKMD
ncbi:MAG TPA: DUF1878 family protein [Bacillota bacterium]|nr:DUF1878 family protein [Bacillota bacterium]